jgi:hypothetical protein
MHTRSIIIAAKKTKRLETIASVPVHHLITLSESSIHLTITYAAVDCIRIRDRETMQQSDTEAGAEHKRKDFVITSLSSASCQSLSNLIIFSGSGSAFNLWLPLPFRREEQIIARILLILSNIIISAILIHFVSHQIIICEPFFFLLSFPNDM